MTDTIRPKRPTIKDVAEAAGVSRGTVSRVINGGHWVSSEAEQAVNRAISSTGFRPNAAARTLKTRRTHSVAMIVLEPERKIFDDPNFAEQVSLTSEALSMHGMMQILLTASTKEQQRRVVNFLASGAVDGALLVSTHAASHQLITEILALSLPVVSFGVPLGFEDRVAYATVDEVQAARTMVRYLRGLGRRCVAIIAGPDDLAGGRLRRIGYELELQGDLDPRLVEVGDFTPESGRVAMGRLLEHNPGIDAVFAANDRMAAGALEMLHATGRTVPGDVAVAGFDDSATARLTDPPLTTMRLPFPRISTEAIRLLINEIDGGGPASVTVPAKLIVRESA